VTYTKITKQSVNTRIIRYAEVPYCDRKLNILILDPLFQAPSSQVALSRPPILSGSWYATKQARIFLEEAWLSSISLTLAVGAFSNNNLLGPQRELIQWHSKLCINMNLVQELMFTRCRSPWSLARYWEENLSHPSQNWELSLPRCLLRSFYWELSLPRCLLRSFLNSFGTYFKDGDNHRLRGSVEYDWPIQLFTPVSSICPSFGLWSQTQLPC